MQNPYVINNPQEHAEFDDIYMKYVREAESKGEITKEEFEACLEKGTQDLRDMGYDSVVYSYGPLEEYIVFESEQAKLADAVTYDDSGDVIPLSKRFNTKESDIRYSISGGENTKKVYKYTEEQYNTFGWTRHEGILTSKMIDRLTSKLYELAEQNVYFHQTESGEYIIPIGEDYGEYDTLVYTDGNYETPNITKVIKLQSEDEYLKEEIWRKLLNGKELTEYNIAATLEDVEAVYGKESIERFIPRDSASFQEYKRGIEGYISREVGDRVGERNTSNRHGSESRADKQRDSTRYSITPDERKSIFQQVADHEITPEEAEKLMQKEKPMATLKKIATTTADKLDGTNFKVKKRKQEIDANRKSKFAESLQSANILDQEFKLCMKPKKQRQKL